MTVEVGLLLAAMSGALSLFTFFVGRQSAAKKDGHAHGTFQAELKKDIEYIKRDVGDIKEALSRSNQEFKADIRRVYDCIEDKFKEHVKVYHDCE